MKKIKLLLLTILLLSLFPIIVYAGEIILVPKEEEEILGEATFNIFGTNPKIINDEFETLLSWPALPVEYQSADFSIKYPKNKVEFISCELNPEMYINRTVPEESEYGYIDCCIVDLDEFESGNLKFKFKILDAGNIQIIAEIENLYYSYINDETVNNYGNDTKEININIPFKSDKINIIEKNSKKYIVGIDEKTTLGELTSIVSSDYTCLRYIDEDVCIIDKNEETLCATGNEIIIAKHVEENIYTNVDAYTIIIYGDTNGDGKINSGDALAIIKNKTNTIPFKSDEFKEAGRVQEKDRGTDEVPSAIDALMIIKHKLGKYKIVQ